MNQKAMAFAGANTSASLSASLLQRPVWELYNTFQILYNDVPRSYIHLWVVRRQLTIDIQNVDHAVARSDGYSAGRSLQEMPQNTAEKSARHADFTRQPKRGTEQSPYSLSERKLRATAFAERVNNLKYYIGLIGAKSII